MEIIYLLLVILILVVIGYLFRTGLKRYWRYGLIVLPFVALVIYKYFFKKDKEDKRGDIRKDIERIKEEIEGVKIESVVEMKIAKEKNEELIKQLEEIKKIEDKRERRKRLAALIK